MRTSCAEATVRLAFRGELQAIGARSFFMAFGGGWRGDDFGGADGLYARSRMLMPVLVRLTDSEIEAIDLVGS